MVVSTDWYSDYFTNPGNETLYNIQCTDTTHRGPQVSTKLENNLIGSRARKVKMTALFFAHQSNGS